MVIGFEIRLSSFVRDSRFLFSFSCPIDLMSAEEEKEPLLRNKKARDDGNRRASRNFQSNLFGALEKSAAN